MKSIFKRHIQICRDFIFSFKGQGALSKHGFSLIEVLVASAVLGIIAVAIASMSGTAFQAASISNSRQDLASLKMVLREQVNCPLTLGLPVDYDFSVPVPCAGPYILKKNSPSGPVNLGGPTTPPDPERTQLGNYKIRASCVANQLQIMVESTRKDPLTKTYLPPKDIFAGAGGNGLCSQYFTGATCPPGRVVTGVANGIPVCSAAVTCPSGQVQTGMSNGVPVCAPSGGCTGGKVQIGESNGLPVCTTPSPCVAPYYQVGFSNGLPVCQYWGGCPSGTVYRGTLSGGTWPVCEVPPPNPVEIWQTGTIGTYVSLCSIPSIGGFIATRHFAGTAYCPAGYSAVSGSGSCNGPTGGILQYSHPVGSNGWSAACCTPLPGASGGTITIRCRRD